MLPEAFSQFVQAVVSFATPFPTAPKSWGVIRSPNLLEICLVTAPVPGAVNVLLPLKLEAATLTVTPPCTTGTSSVPASGVVAAGRFEILTPAIFCSFTPKT